MHLPNPYAFAWLPLIAVLLLVAPRQRRAVANVYLWRQTKPPDPARSRARPEAWCPRSSSHRRGWARVGGVPRAIAQKETL
jgi:ferric-dicitrate binding protein FerR (iron transport regulator)